jgi:hypothetical protein
LKIIIDENICSKIEVLHYEVESRKEIITALLKVGTIAESELFKNYNNEYKKYFIEYNKAKQEMLEEYKIPNNCVWKLDFSTKELFYEEKS